MTAKAKAPALKAQSRKKDTIDKVIAKVRARAPKEGSNKGEIEISRTNTNILSSVKYGLKTGVDSFDEAVGPLPFGRVVEIYGLESCGKTAFCIRSALQAQIGEVYIKEQDPDEPEKVLWRKLDPDVDEIDVNVVFIDNEQSIEDDEKVSFPHPVTGEPVEIDCAVARCDTVEQLFKISETVVDAIAEVQKETKRIQLTLLVVDTIAGTASKEELAAEWDKDDYPRQPKQLRKGFRRMIRKLSRNNVLMLCTNQVSDRFKSQLEMMQRKNTLTPQAADFDTFGGRALKFYASIRVFMYRMPSTFKLSKAEQFASGLLIGFATPKNRLRPPLREARAVILFNHGGLNDAFSRLETLIFLKIVDRSKKTGEIKFNFEKHGITPRTFDADTGESLEDEDLGRRRSSRSKSNSKFSIPHRGAYFEFYEEHKVDMDALWNYGKRKLFEEDFGVSGDSDEDPDADLDEEDDD